MPVSTMRLLEPDKTSLDGSDDRRDSGQDPTILIVDVDAESRRSLQALLEKHKYRVLTATSGAGALELIKARPVSIVVSDVTIPAVVDGIALCREIKADPRLRQIPVIFLTAKDSLADKVLGLETGADDYVTKPFHSEELVARIRTRLRIRQMAQETLAPQASPTPFPKSGLSHTNPPAVTQVMRDIVKRFLETMQVDRCAIFLGAAADATAHLLLAHDRFKAHPWSEGANLPLDRYPEIRRVLETQQPLVVPNVTKEPVLAAVRDLLVSHSIHSMLVIPLLTQDQCIGAVSLSSRREIRNFTRGEIELCQTLANQAALAMVQGPLFQEARDRAGKLQTLIHLTKMMTASLNPQEVFDFAVKAAAEFLEVPCVGLWMADEDTHELVMQASHGLHDFRLMVDRIPHGKGIIGEIMERREPQYFADVRQESRWFNRQLLEEAGIVSFAGIPLITEERILGVLCVFTHHRRLFSHDERALMGTFASQAAVAIANAKAYQQIHRYATTVQDLYEAATQVSGSLDLDETLQKIGRGAAACADATSSSIVLFDELGEVSQAVGWEVGEIDVRKDGGSRRVWETGRPVVLPDFSAVPPGTVNPRLLELGRRAAVCLPLRVRERVRGVLWVHYNEPRRFADEDIHLLSYFANQAAIAIENARLFAETTRLANTDPLTGLYNHRYFYHLLETEVKRARRYSRPLSLIMLDIDHFKQFNDRFGHLAGDEALRCLAQILRKNSRGVDMVARYGGEEFAIILPETDLAQAAVQAERLRTAAAEQQWPEGQLTISLGAAVLGTDMSKAEDVVRDADRALYEAKAAGRNQVCLSPLPGDG